VFKFTHRKAIRRISKKENITLMSGLEPKIARSKLKRGIGRASKFNEDGS
jgi:hypothetical protein